jgi:tetratricopeptide (TPR) repeat protein
MEDEHVSPEIMERFLRATLAREEMLLVVNHLLPGCEACSALAHSLADESGSRLIDPILEAEPGPHGWSYEPTFAAAASRLPEQAERLAQERLAGLGLWLELSALPVPLRHARVAAEGRFARFGLYDYLMAESQRLCRREPSTALAAADLAVAVSERLTAPDAEEGLVHDFRAAAHGARANVRRILSDFAGAAGDIRAAWSAFGSGTADPAEEAGLRRLEGYLLLDLGSFERAVERFGDALAIYREIGDRPQQARVFVQQSEALGYLDPQAAVSRLSRALPWIARSDEPRLSLAAHHNLLWFLNDAGRAAEARPALANVVGPLYEPFAGEPSVALRRRWLEGRISRTLDGAPAAEGQLRRAWEGFAEMGLGHDLAMVAVDLLESLTAQGKSQESLALASQALPLLSSYGLHAEGLEVWLLLTHTLKRRAVEAGAFAKASAYFRRNFKHPRRQRP